MIRINLLPSKEVEARGNTDLIVGGVVLFLLIVSIIAVHLYQAKSFRDVKRETARVEKRIKELEEVVKKVEAFKAKSAELERRIKLIETLEQNRAAQLYVLQSLAGAIPERAWLDRFTEKGSSAAIEGVAWNEFIVSDFMKGLKSSNYFNTVELVKIEKKEIRNLPLRSFKLDSILNFSGKVSPDSTKEQIKDSVNKDNKANKTNL